MGFRFRKSFKIAPGVRVNIGNKGVSSISAGVKGARVSVSKKGTRTTISAPGTGLSYSSYKAHSNKKNTTKTVPDYTNPNNLWGYPKSELFIGGVVALLVFSLFVWIVG